MAARRSARFAQFDFDCVIGIFLSDSGLASRRSAGCGAAPKDLTAASDAAIVALWYRNTCLCNDRPAAMHEA
jgi:hypothetical protein